MAKKTILVDDIDGSETDVGTVVFSFEGDVYEIDLSPANLEGLRAALKPYASVARSAVRTARRKRPSSSGSKAPVTEFLSRDQSAAVRDWARSQGYDVLNRGAFSKEVLAAYQAAHAHGAGT